ncbi:MAG: hypothetical protein ABSA74_00220 [Candidatus Staskawiczbacteria bacterium]|jgi:hypothetical protein
MNFRLYKQIKTLKFSLSVGQKQIAEIEDRLKNKFIELSVEDKKEFLRNEAKYLYLKNFWQQYEFLVKRIKAENNFKNFQFYIPLVRILLENYGEFLYFSNQSDKNQLGLYSSNYLLYLSDFYRFVAIGNEEIKNEYNRLVGVWNEALSSEKITFPADITSFTYTKLKDIGFIFPNYEQIFKEVYFASDSSLTFTLWEKDNASNFYNKYYRTHSNYTHPSFTNQMSGATKNEIFWIIQFMYIISQLFIECGNKKVFDGKFQKEYEELTKRISKSYPKLQKMWRAKKVETTSESH